VAGKALGDLDLHFAWHWAGSGGALGSQLTPWTPRLFAWQACGTWRDMDVHFAWQTRHLWHWAGSGGALGSQLTSWTPRLFAWQVWHLVTLALGDIDLHFA